MSPQQTIRDEALHKNKSPSEAAHQIKFFETLDEVARSIRHAKYDQAIQLLQVLMRASMQQNVDLILQRYLSELSMECIELSGDSKTSFEYVEQALLQYEGKDLLSSDAKKDKLILLLRKAYLLIKLDKKDALAQHINELKSQLKHNKNKKVQSMLRRMQQFNGATEHSILAEQRQLGLFQLSDQLKKQGARLVCGVR